MRFRRIGALSEIKLAAAATQRIQLSKFDLDQRKVWPRDNSFCIDNGGTFMPIESALAVAAITVVFVGFAAVLWWAEHQTRNLSH